jgi:hypothetical protein
LLPSLVPAASIAPLNLAEMTRRADRIFRGTVLGATSGTTRFAGGELPIVTYRIRVDEPLKGKFEEADGAEFVEVRMLDGSGAKRDRAGYRQLIPGMPLLRQGESYLLLTTRPGRSGLSSTVGLTQGTFRMSGSGAGALARNGTDNLKLFRGMDPEGLPDRGPCTWRPRPRVSIRCATSTTPVWARRSRERRRSSGTRARG